MRSESENFLQGLAKLLPDANPKSVWDWVSYPLVVSRKLCFYDGMKRLIVAIRKFNYSIILVSFLAGSDANPEPEGRQLLLVAKSEITQLDINSFDQMKIEMPISKDPQANELVRRVGKRIDSVVNLP